MSGAAEASPRVLAIRVWKVVDRRLDQLLSDLARLKQQLRDGVAAERVPVIRITEIEQDLIVLEKYLQNTIRRSRL